LRPFFGLAIDFEAKSMTSVGNSMAQAPAGNSPTGKNRVAKAPVVMSAPAAETRPPTFWRFGAVLAVFFSIGFAWPVFGGVNFVQRPPGSSAAKIAEVEAAALEVDPALASASAEVDALQARQLADRGSVRIEGSTVQSCQGDSGERVARCDEPSLDGMIEEPIGKLAGCEGAKGLSGVLSLGLELDFARGRVSRVQAGPNTTLTKEQTQRLVACAEGVLVGTALDDVEHENARYWVYYRVRFALPGSAVEAEPARAVEAEPARAVEAEPARAVEAEPARAVEAEPEAPSQALVGASGQATVAWKAASVRESASSQSRLVTELAYGTRVNVTGRVGEWYRIERAGKVLGWVHRQALGM
jgi:SH3 domain-containing protein